MKRTTSHYVCSKCNEQHDAEFWTTPSRWLLVGGHNDLCDLEEGEWVIVHARSGLIAAEAPDPETAMFMVQRLMECGIDWSLSGTEVAEQQHLVPEDLLDTIESPKYDSGPKPDYVADAARL